MTRKPKHKKPQEPLSPQDQPAPETAPGQQPAAEAEQPAPAPEPTCQQQLAELQDRYQRLAADYANYQKRAQRQIEQSAQFARENFARGLLQVLDNFEHTLNQGGGASDPAHIIEGVRIVYDHLMNILEGCGLSRIAVQADAEFDPTVHEAVLHEETDQYPENHVVRELAPGYTMNERTLRPAKVSVAKAPAPPAEEQPPEKENTQPDQTTDENQPQNDGEKKQ